MNVRSKESRGGDIVFIVICILISIICIIPMINLAAKSLSGTEFLIRHEVMTVT